VRSARASLTRLVAPGVVLVLAVSAAARQAPDRDERRVADRIHALQQEAERLAAQSRTLVGELQKLEVERQLRAAEAAQAEAERTAAEHTLKEAADRLAALEAQREAQLPDLKTQLVDLYKRGHRGYASILFGGGDIRDLARATRAIAALASMNARRLAEHRQTIEALQREQARLEQATKDLQARAAAAEEARAAADRAVAARTALAARIDSRRDLTAQYVGELQVAYERLQQQVGSAAGGNDAATVPIGPFRGALDWPAAGPVRARFGQTANRLGGSAVRNGIEIAAPEGTPVHAVHGGTVAFADTYPGFGTLVIVDHGSNNYSLYGYLASTSVTRGDAVAGGAELGRVGTPPGGTPALYFEMRIDGRSVDPLQWLKMR
jgi:septal ring factor EnvC (AmiA/AmiB activator)